MRRFSHMVLGFLVGFATAEPPITAEEPSPLVFCFEKWLPYYHKPANAPASGPVIDAVLHALEAEGVRAEFRRAPHSRCIAAVQDGTMDGILGVRASETNMAIVSTPIVNWKISAVVGAQSTITAYKTLDAFTNHQVIIYGQYKHPEPLASFLRHHDRKSLIPSEDSNIRVFDILEKRRKSVLFVDGVWAQTMIREGAFKGRVLSPPVVIEPIFWALANKYEGLAQRLAPHLQTIEVND